MSIQAKHSLRAGVVAFAPVLLLATLSYHPYIPGLPPNVESLASEVTADPTRWGVVHVASGVASAIVAVAFLAIRSHLRELGEDRWSAGALPFVVIGSTLYAMLPGMEFAPLAANEAGGDVGATQDAVIPWFIPLLIAGAVAFAVGMIGFAIGISRVGLLSSWLTRVVVVALLVMALSRFVPLSAVQFYVHGVAALVAMVPVAYTMWKHPSASSVDAQRAVPTT